MQRFQRNDLPSPHGVVYRDHASDSCATDSDIVMKLLALLFGISLCSSVAAEPCPGPAGCGQPIGPPILCIRDHCQPVQYSWTGDLAIAESMLPNGYSVLGWAGPCLSEDRSQCQDIFNQAFADLRINALRANRAQEAD